MKLSQFKKQLENISEVTFVQPDGHLVPAHFHITEAGITTKQFIDCGGIMRKEQNISFQLWVAHDEDHRLSSIKLQKIIGIFESTFHPEDDEVEVEYQGSTIGRYGLETDGENFQLVEKKTDCLAKDTCCVGSAKPKLQMADIGKSASCCEPASGCCS